MGGTVHTSGDGRTARGAVWRARAGDARAGDAADTARWYPLSEQFMPTQSLQPASQAGRSFAPSARRPILPRLARVLTARARLPRVRARSRDAEDCARSK